MKKTLVLEAKYLHPSGAILGDYTPGEWDYAKLEDVTERASYFGDLKGYALSRLDEFNRQACGDTFHLIKADKGPNIYNVPCDAEVIVANDGTPVFACYSEQLSESFDKFTGIFLDEMLEALDDCNWQVCAEVAVRLIRAGYNKDDIIDLFPIPAERIEDRLKKEAF